MSDIILFYQTQKKIESLLETFLIKTGAQRIFFATKSGEVLVYSGSKAGEKVRSMAALLASVFNATEELAHLVDESHFKQFFLKGKEWNLFYHNVDSLFLMVVVFKEESLLGSVRVLSVDLASELKKALKEECEEEAPSLVGFDEKELMEDLFTQ